MTTAQIGSLMGVRTEFYQPLAVDRGFFAAPSLGLGISGEGDGTGYISIGWR